MKQQITLKNRIGENATCRLVSAGVGLTILGFTERVRICFRPLRTFLGRSARARLFRIILPLPLATIAAALMIDRAMAGWPPGSRALAVCLLALAALVATALAVSRAAHGIDAEIDGREREQELSLQTMQASEDKFRALSENSLAGIYIIQDGVFAYVNPRFAEIFGYRREEISAGKPVEELIVEQDRDRVLENIAKRMDNRIATINHCFQGRRKDGSVVDVEVFGSRTDYHGRPAVMGTLLDITERNRAERLLREASTLYEKTLSSLNETVFIANPMSRTISRCNQTAERMFGYTRDELLGKDTRFIHVDEGMYREFGMRAMKAVGAGHSTTFPFKMKRKNGEVFDTEHFVTPLYDEQGKMLGIVSVIRDITDRIRKERSIGEANERLEAVLNSLDAFVYVTDIETHEIYFTNRFGTELFGDIVGKICYEALHKGASGPCPFCTKNRLINDRGEPTGSNFWELLNDRTGKWYHVHDHALRWTNGRMAKIAIATDITERKKTEKLLEESERRFRAIFENVQLVAIGLDCDGNVTFCNDFMLKLTGYRKDELLGRSWFELMVPRDEDVHGIFSESRCTGTMPLHVEYPIVTRQGERRTISWNNIVLRDHEGAVIGIAGLGEDITERKSLEAQLIHAQKMESIGTLAGGIAHDFNNILTAIIGFGNVLSRKLPSDDPLTFYVDQILDASESAANLTRSLLAFGRKQVMNPKPQDLNEIVAKLEKFLSRIIGEDIACSTFLWPDPLGILADFGQIEQVLMNLIVNARDAMPRGGTLTIRTRRLDLNHDFVRLHGFGRPGAYAWLSMADTGTGMDEKTLARIFEPFFTTKEINKGTGLGLSIVYGIIKQHAGYITVDSRPGAGTTVDIYFPIHAAFLLHCDATPRKRIGSGPSGNETVLVAEDNDHLRELITTVLTESGYTVIGADDGSSAVERARETDGSIDLFLLDVIMPKKNGAEVYRDILKNRPDAKVLFLSGYTADIMDQAGIADKSFNFIAKPVSPSELLRKVREVLDGEFSQL